VAAAADGQLEPGVARERDDARHLSRIDGADDGGGPPVDVAGEHGPSVVVACVGRSDHLAKEVIAERGDRNGLHRCHRFLLGSFIT
jgi:hypothetical protein